MKLQRLDLEHFPNLQKLDLSGNLLTTITGTKIERMAALRVLDLRANRLQDDKEIIKLVNRLPNLIYLGLYGMFCF